MYHTPFECVYLGLVHSISGATFASVSAFEHSRLQVFLYFLRTQSQECYLKINACYYTRSGYMNKVHDTPMHLSRVSTKVGLFSGHTSGGMDDGTFRLLHILRWRIYTPRRLTY